MILSLRDVKVQYEEKTVIDTLSFQVDRGEILCLKGHSGCGKTSVINAVMGFVPFMGEITVMDKHLTDSTVDEIRRHIAYIPQELALPQETVLDMVRLPFSLKSNRHVSFSEKLLFDEWKMLNLEPELLSRGTNEISGGQRQRIMLSVAGLLGKDLLLIDEPTSALDTGSVQLVLDYLHYLASERGMAIVAASHHSEISNGSTKVIDFD